MASGENKANGMKDSLDRARAAKKETEGQIDELQEQLKALQAEYDTKLKSMQAEGREEVDSRLERARLEINNRVERALSNNMDKVTERYSTHATDKIKNRSTDVLRMNKIFRDVSRSLGENWRPVYDTLTLEFPPSVTNNELIKIEQQKPYMQAYKALNSWKDLCGQNFNLNKLPDALVKCNLHELADMVLATMESEGEELTSLSYVGKGIAPGVPRQSSLDGGGAAAGGMGQGGASGEEAGQARPTPPSASGVATDVLSDRRLLQLAKQIGGSWMDLGRALQFPDDELQEILQNEGMSYQGAFKVLWGWRDRNADAMYQDNVQILQDALRNTNRAEMADSLSK